MAHGKDEAEMGSRERVWDHARLFRGSVSACIQLETGRTDVDVQAQSLD